MMPLGLNRVKLQIVASLIDDSRGVIYDHSMFIVQATCVFFTNRLFCHSFIFAVKLVGNRNSGAPKRHHKASFNPACKNELVRVCLEHLKTH